MSSGSILSDEVVWDEADYTFQCFLIAGLDQFVDFRAASMHFTPLQPCIHCPSMRPIPRGPPRYIIRLVKRLVCLYVAFVRYLNHEKCKQKILISSLKVRYWRKEKKIKIIRFQLKLLSLVTFFLEKGRLLDNDVHACSYKACTFIVIFH